MDNILKLERLKNRIKQEASASQLPIEIIYLLFKDLTNQLGILYKNQLDEQFRKAALEEALNKSKEKQSKQEQKKSQESQD